MRISTIHLSNYKRFTNLTVGTIPKTSRLVVLTGPNGSGKSSLFDAFLVKARRSLGDYLIDRHAVDYYFKDQGSWNTQSSTRAVANRIGITLHDPQPTPDDWSKVFNIRSPYRHEADFRISSLQSLPPASEKTRFDRIIDSDRAVSENYTRLVWKRMRDLDASAPGRTTFEWYREHSLRDIQDAMASLFSDPELILQNFGGVTAGGGFRFTKGTTTDFHYKNLSGGEKAAFDLLLDVFVKRDEFRDAIYCIDEPEAHVATPLHGPLLEAICAIIPEEAQVWIATHSIGFIRRASQMMEETGDVTFLDFSKHNFDDNIVIEPHRPNRIFWQRTYAATLDDLAELIVPSNIVLCEGNAKHPTTAFDADCYNKLFGDAHPDTLFLSVGGANDVHKSKQLVTILEATARGATVWRVTDRDDMSEGQRERYMKTGVRVLRRREIENYLFDEAVLRTFLTTHQQEEHVDVIIDRCTELLGGHSAETVDMKAITQELFQFIKRTTTIPNLGNRRDEFALDFLVPALQDTTAVFTELHEDVFGSG